MLNANLTAVLYLVAGVLFIQALRGLSSPETSRRGNYLGIAGMAIAVLTTLANAVPGLGGFALIVLGMAIGGGVGAYIARQIPMTAMPQRVAAFHSLVGLAAVLVAAAALNAPEFRTRIEASVGTLVSIENAATLEARIRRESAAWAKLIKAAKVDLQ